MTQEEKQLLLKDLCARLPYGVNVRYKSVEGEGDSKLGYANISYVSELSRGWWMKECKPYLRPIKSMTSYECDKLFKILDIREDSGEWLKINDIGVLRLFTENGKDFYEIAKAMDYLYSIHIDFRGLIEKGLALEAPNDMYKEE